MTRQDEDREGAKPYKTYKARRPRRSQVDDELGGRAAGARASARRRARRLGERARLPAQSDKAYRTYGPAPENGRKAGKRKATKGAGPAPRRRRRFRWWYIPVGVFAVLVIAGVVFTVLAWPGYQKFDRAVDKANKRVDKKTRAQLTADDGWIWRNGTTVAAVRPRRRRAPGALRHDHAHALRPGTPHDQPALDPARHAGQRRRLRTEQDHAGDVVRRARHWPSRRSRSSPASPSTTSWSWASRGSRAS